MDDAKRMAQHEKKLAEKAGRYRIASAELAAAREELRRSILDADGDGMRQVDILRATNHVYTREQVRKICLDDINPS